MKNKIELKKMYIISTMVILIFLMLIALIIYHQYKEYTYNFNQRIASIVTKITKEYPQVNKEDIIEILNQDENENNDIFREYGIDLEKDSAILENDQKFKEFIIVDIIVISIFIVTIEIIFLIYNHQKEKKIQEITKYLEEINRGNYKLDIEDNTEDELSILKNELCKTTVMLNEVAENSRKDKINLKNSLSDISHQLKTPITSINIMLDNILEDKNMPEDIRNDFLKNIKREIVNTSFLVESILKLSKIDSNSVKFIIKEVTVYDIIKAVKQNVAIISELKGIDINVKGNKTDSIKCDEKWQIEAITNIVKNCIEHSRENEKLEIIYEKNKMYTEIKIKDYGVGISKKDLPHIFERFYKGENSSSDSVGIGLALSKAIIESNNGYIQVESELGKGTIFKIRYINI